MNDDIFGNFGKTPHFRSHFFNSDTPSKKEKIQDPPVEHDIYCTLEEIFVGCQKKMKISRKVLQNDGSYKKEEKTVCISVKPGEILRNS